MTSRPSWTPSAWAANLRQSQEAMSYLLAVHVPIAGMSVLPLFFGWPLVLSGHIVFLELVIDPTCSIAFEAEPAEPDVMSRPPRSATSRLFNGWMIATSVLQGVSVLVAVALLYALVLDAGTPEPQARAMAFAAIVPGNLGLISRHSLASRDAARHAATTESRAVVDRGGALLGLALALYVEPMNEIFRFASSSGYQLLLRVAAAALGLTWLEL